MTLRVVGTAHRTPDVGFDSGLYEIHGSVKNTGAPNTPVFRRIRLHEQSSSRFIRETWSDPITGAYSFTGLRLTTYYVVSFDHTGTYNGVIKSDVIPELPS
jgi:hypothetical protein